jgi:hypothetical protein
MSEKASGIDDEITETVAKWIPFTVTVTLSRFPAA